MQTTHILSVIIMLVLMWYTSEKHFNTAKNKKNGRIRKLCCR